jgi:hypothetical protein
MKKVYLKVMILFLITFGNTNAQVGIGNTDPASSSILDVTSDNRGLLIPRMTTLERNAIGVPASGLLVYNTTDLDFNYYEDGGWKDFSPAFYELSNTSQTIVSSINETLVPGMSITPDPGNYLVHFNAQYSFFSSITAIAADLLNTLVTRLNTLGNADSFLPVYNTKTPISTPLVGHTFLPGIYEPAAALSIQGATILDAEGDPTKIFVIRAGTLEFTAATTIELRGGALAKNVFWISNAALNIGANSIIKGNLISANAAVGVGANCVIDGKLMTKNGAITTNNSTITNIDSNPLLEFGLLDSFAVFSSVGNIANTSFSKITGNIGANSGIISTFGAKYPAIDLTNGWVDGNIYYPGYQLSTGTFSIYQNGVPILNSVRTRSSTLNTVDISLQTIATVLPITTITNPITPPNTIEIRCSVDSGLLKLTNKSFSIINLK